MDNKAEAIYKARIARCDDRISRIKNRENILIVLKLLIASVGIFILYKIVMTNQNRYLLMLGIAIILFSIPAIIHEHYIKKRSFVSSVKSLNEMEIRALGHQYPDLDDGESYRNPDHPYSTDLDLFGARSVFHFINRAVTSLGTDRLASWLEKAPEDSERSVILARQEAVQELSGQIDLRQNIQAHGRTIRPSKDLSKVIPRMMAEPHFLLNKKILVWLIHLLPGITLTSAVGLFFGIHWLIPLILLSVHLVINRSTREHAYRMYLLTSRNAALFKAYARIIEEMENIPAQSALLQNMRQTLHSGKKPASAHIRRLSTIAAFFEIRLSEVLHPVLNSLLLWDLHCILHIERWKSRCLTQAPAWFQAIGDFEALASLAALNFNNPTWVFPDIAPSGFLLRAESLGHFLIPPEERVCNDVHIEGKGSILIITGPNMAGKSTFLKTVGVNLVLAMAGGPVCASSCRVSPLNLITSMKVSDSLDKHLSLFYAELQKMKNILDTIEEKGRVFFLLDEMLKGTNALDRQAGALALLKQLAGQNAAGVVATHDLELTKLEETFPERISNRHFDGFIEGEKLLFDYKLKPGKCKSFNALALMRKIGIDIQPGREPNPPKW